MVNYKNVAEIQHLMMHMYDDDFLDYFDEKIDKDIIKKKDWYTKHHYNTDLANRNYLILDCIDFIPLLEKYKELGDLVDKMEDTYDCGNYVSGYHCIFNEIDDYELSEYLSKRYNIQIDEIETAPRYRIHYK